MRGTKSSSRLIHPSQEAFAAAGVATSDHRSHAVPTLIRGLAVVLPALYAVDYASATVLSAALGVDFKGDAAFDHEAFTPDVSGGERRPLVNWLSFMLAFAIAGPPLVFGTRYHAIAMQRTLRSLFPPSRALSLSLSLSVCVRDAHRAVDAASVVLTMHFFICTTVTQRLPENWAWWATVMPTWLWLGRLSEFLLERFSWRLRPH